MSKYVLGALCVAVLVGGTVESLAQGSWKPFKSAQGRFTCVMPGSPQYQKTQVPTAVGPVDSHMYTGISGNSAFVAGYADYPAKLVAQSNAKKVVDGAQNGAITNVKGTLISQREIKLGAFPGKEFSCSIPNDLVLKARVYMVKNRLYQAMAVTPKGEAGVPEVNKFLGSLKVTPGK